MRWLARNYLLLGAALAAYAAIFSARFSVSRLLPNVKPEWLLLAEARTWALLTWAVLIAVGWRSLNGTNCPANMSRVWRSVGLVAITQCVLLAHAVLYRPSAHSAYFAWELITIMLSGAMLGLAYQMWGLRFVKTVLWVSLMVALAVTIWVLASSRLTRPASDSGPLATVFTYYRIQIFGGFAALFLWFQGRGTARGFCLALGAVLCFAAAYLSLSKAALLAGLGALLFLAAVYFIWFEKVRAAAVAGVSVAAVVLFVLVSGGLFASRVSEGLLGAGYALSTQSVPPPSLDEASIAIESNYKGMDKCMDNCVSAAVGERVDGRLLIARVQFEAQRRLAAIVACTAGKYPCGFAVARSEQDIADTMLRFRVYIPDFSFRIRLLMEGLGGISKAPWLGNGFGSFHAVATNLYTAKPESYSHPHNILVELLYSVGLLGALLVAAALFVLTWEVLRARERIHDGLPLIASVVAVGIGSVFGGDYMDFRLVWIGFLLSVMLCELPGRSGSAPGGHAV